MTSFEQLSREEDLEQGLQQGRRTDHEYIKDVTGLSDQGLLRLEN